MKAGDKCIWIDEGHGGVKRNAKVLAVFKIEDAVNKSIIGKTLYHLDVNGYDVRVFEDDIELMK